MTHPVFDKTNKGREEMATRKHQLAPRLRTLLLLFDGKRSTEEVLEKVAGIGLDNRSIKELLTGRFVQPVLDNADFAASEWAVTEADKIAANDAPKPAVAARAAKSATIQPDVAPPKAAATDDPARLQALYDFYTETIRSTIGLRGYALQSKVERAKSIEDFRAMRDVYLAAVQKAQGLETARELYFRLERLLNME